MSTEQKKDTETTALAEKLSTGWTQFKQGQLVSYKVMALILVAVTAIGLYLYIRSEQAVGTSKTWLEFESSTSVKSLEEFAERNPNTTAGKAAQVQIARYRLGPDGIDKLMTREEAQRKAAIENVEKARESFTKLADELKNDPILQAECYLGLAKAEIALVGINKEGSADEFRGKVEKAAEWLEKLAAAADGTPWGDDAKKFAAALKTPSGPVPEELMRVQSNLYNMALLPSLPGEGPLSPPGGTPKLPILPGGPTGATIEPAPPKVTPPPPTGSAPIPPAVAPLVPGGQPSTPVPTGTPVTPPPPAGGKNAITPAAPISPPSTPPSTPPAPPKK